MAFRRPRPKNWADDGSLQMLLLFGESLQEMLFDYTVDSYKASTLNIHTNLIELRYMSRLFQRNRIKSGTLIPLIHEFKNKVENDPVLTKEQRKVFSVYTERIDAERTKPASLKAIIEALLVEFETFYWDALKHRIAAAVRIPNNSSEVLSLADTFVSEAEWQGYDRSYLFHSSRLFFFGREKIVNIDAIDRFLALFDLSEKKYKCIFRASSTFLELVDFARPFNMKITVEAPEISNPRSKSNTFLRPMEELPVYVVVDKLEAMDPLSARHYAEYMIEGLANTYNYHIHQQKLSWKKQCLCIADDGSVQSILNPPISPMRKRLHSTVIEQKSAMTKTVELLTGGHFQDDDTFLFRKALEYHREALEANTPENQLLDIWAAIEGFLPTPEGDMDKISHYVGTIMPAITLTYPERLFRYILDCLQRESDEIRQLIEDIPITASSFEKVTCMLSCEDLKDKQRELCGLLAKSPLLRYHCFKLFKSFHSSKSIKKTINMHRDRVAWHIQRIYATRNTISHSAESLPYIESLVESLHTYLDILLSAITTVGIRSARRASIPGVTKLLSLHEQAFFKDLEATTDNCNPDNYKNVIFGRHNPLSPFVKGLTIAP